MSSTGRGSVATLLGTLFNDGSAVGMSDEELIERFVSRGDGSAEYAFKAIVERHGPMVLSVCRHALRDPHDVDDAFQAAFFILARKAAHLSARGQLANWLFGVARRTSLQVKARRARRERLNGQALAQAPLALTHGPDHDAICREDYEMLHEEIGRLPDRYRAAVVLCYLEGLTQQEAARRLGWPIGTVGVRLMRARDRLRDQLTRRGMSPNRTALLPLSLAGQPLKASLAAKIARSASSFAARTALARWCGPSEAGGVAIAVLRAMLVTKFAAAAGVVLLCGLSAGGTALALWACGWHDSPPQPPAALKAAPPVGQDRSILSNGGFEDGDSKKPVPNGWKQGATIAGVEYQWDRTVAHQGRASLHLKKTAQRYFPIAQWFQEVQRSGKSPRLKVSAFVKAEKMTKAILDVSFVDASDNWSHHWAAYIGAKNDGDPAATHDWKQYEGIVEIPKDTRQIVVAVQIYGPGDVWVDDISAIYTDEKATDPLAALADERGD